MLGTLWLIKQKAPNKEFDNILFTQNFYFKQAFGKSPTLKELCSKVDKCINCLI